MEDQSLIKLLPNLPLIGNPEDITEATRLEEDLMLFGYAARMFIFRYSEVFDVNISEFNFNKYFSKDTPTSQAWRHIFKRRKNILTIGHLQRAIQYGELNDKVIGYIDKKAPIKKERKKIFFRTSYRPPQLTDKIIYILLFIVLTLFLSIVAISI